MANCGDGRHEWNFGEVTNEELLKMEEIFDLDEFDEDEEYRIKEIENRIKDSYGDGAVKFSWTCNECHRKVVAFLPIRMITAFSSDKAGTRRTTFRNSEY